MGLEETYVSDWDDPEYWQLLIDENDRQKEAWADGLLDSLILWRRPSWAEV